MDGQRGAAELTRVWPEDCYTSADAKVLRAYWGLTCCRPRGLRNRTGCRWCGRTFGIAWGAADVAGLGGMVAMIAAATVCGLALVALCAVRAVAGDVLSVPSLRR